MEQQPVGFIQISLAENLTRTLAPEFCAPFGIPAKNYSNGGPDAITGRQGRRNIHE